MQELSLKKFNPLKKEVSDLVENCKNTIVSIKNGKELNRYELLKDTATTLQKKRSNIVEVLKDERSFALKYQKTIIVFEKELLEIITPAELEIEEILKPIEEEKTKEKHRPFLEERIAKLKEIEVEATEDSLLMMTEHKFELYLEDQAGQYLEAKLEIKRIADIKAKAIKDTEDKAKIDKEKAKRKAEIDKQTAIEQTQRKADLEKQNIIDEQKRKDDERIANEKKAKEDKEEKERIEQEELDKKEKNKKYQKFLEDNGYTEETKQDFYISRDGDTFTIYEKLNSIIIK